MNELKAGDCVVIKSGGPKMTIKAIHKHGSTSQKDVAECVWFDYNSLKEGFFVLESIKKAGFWLV